MQCESDGDPFMATYSGIEGNVVLFLGIISAKRLPVMKYKSALISIMLTQIYDTNKSKMQIDFKKIQIEDFKIRMVFACVCAHFRKSQQQHFPKFAARVA